MRAIPEDDEPIRLHASRVVHTANIRRKELDAQPTRDRMVSSTMSALVRINGVLAYTLFDSGSTTDSVSPKFAVVAKAKRITLDQQVTLQLGCAGSRSKISYGTRVPVDICGIRGDHYFDIVNLDRYDCIVGTPFMNQHGVVLDFKTRNIQVNGQAFAAFSYEEDREYRKNKPPSARNDHS